MKFNFCNNLCEENKCNMRLLHKHTFHHLIFHDLAENLPPYFVSQLNVAKLPHFVTTNSMPTVVIGKMHT